MPCEWHMPWHSFIGLTDEFVHLRSCMCCSCNVELEQGSREAGGELFGIVAMSRDCDGRKRRCQCKALSRASVLNDTRAAGEA